MNNKPQPVALTGAAKWNAASTVDELQAAVAEIDAEIAALGRRKAELETDPGAFVLAGGDLGERSREAGGVAYKIAAFESARATIDGRRKAATAEHHRQLAERDLAAAHERIPELTAAWRHLRDLLEEIAEASEGIGKIARDIDAMGTRASQAGFPKEKFPHLLRIRVEASADRQPPRSTYERHAHDADPLAIRAGQLVKIVLGRCDHTSGGASLATNAEILNRAVTRDAREAAQARRASLPQPISTAA